MGNLKFILRNERWSNKVIEYQEIQKWFRYMEATVYQNSGEWRNCITSYGDNAMYYYYYI